MAERTHGTAIEWTHGEGFRGETWNPVTGCDRISPGCAHCYARTMAKRLKAMGNPRYQTDGDGPGFGVTVHPDLLEVPLRWRRPRMVFVNSMSDLFHEEIPYEFVREVFNVMRRCTGYLVAATGKRNPAHIFQVLTKRPERALELWRDRKLGFHDWPAHVWLGVSIENARHTWRADILRDIPAAVRFISAEPLLGSLLDVRAKPTGGGSCGPDAGPSPNARQPLDLTGIDWVIVGGESSPGARPMRLSWALELVEACRAASVACFVKQLGKHLGAAHLAGSKGGDFEQFPPSLRVREMPEVSRCRAVSTTDVGRSHPLADPRAVAA